MRIDDYLARRDDARSRGMMFVLITCTDCGQDAFAEFTRSSYSLERIQAFFKQKGWSFPAYEPGQVESGAAVSLCPRCTRRR